MYYLIHYIDILLIRGSPLNSHFKRRTRCHSFMALNWASDMSNSRLAISNSLFLNTIRSVVSNRANQWADLIQSPSRCFVTSCLRKKLTRKTLLALLCLKFSIILIERAFKMMKNGFYFIVIALLVAELFKIFIYANLDDLWFHNVDTGVKSQKKLISLTSFPV